MSRLLAVLLGALLFTALTVFCVARQSPIIVEKLTAGSASSLADEGMDWAVATVDGRGVTLTGFAPSEEERLRAIEVVRGVPGVGRIDDRLALKPRVFEFVAYRRGYRVVLSGNVPDNQSKSEMVTRAASLFGDAAVVDELFVSGPPPDEAWVAMARRGIDLLVKLDSGRVRLRNRDVALSGVAATTQEQDRIGFELLEELPAGYTSSVDITVPEQGGLSSEECAAAFEALMLGSQISFETDSARLTPESSPVLNEVVSLAKRCPNTHIEVRGHTDSLGDADRNLTLSRQRALAVLDYIVGRGVDARRIAARGFGETQPVATNRTRRGRALNRRIEFNVEG
jgi:OOP family OmpA-OmpF porin